jgi:hypothetical protein
MTIPNKPPDAEPDAAFWYDERGVYFRMGSYTTYALYSSENFDDQVIDYCNTIKRVMLATHPKRNQQSTEATDGTN